MQSAVAFVLFSKSNNTCNSKCAVAFACVVAVVLIQNLQHTQAGAPARACHDNVKSLGKKSHSIVGLLFTNIWTYSGKAYVL